MSFENPSAAFLAGQQHGAALAIQHNTPAKPTPKPAAPTRTPAKTAPAKPGGTQGDALLAQAQQIAKAQTDAIVNAILAQQNVYTRQGQQQATDIQNASQAAAGLLNQWNLPGTTTQSYTDAAKAVGALAQGFSGQTREDATNAANQVAANLASLGAPAGGLKTSTGQTIQPEAQGNVLYGLGGFIPGNLLETVGPAVAAHLASLPGSLLATGQDKGAAALQAAANKADTLTPQIVAAQGNESSLVRQAYSSLLSAQNQAFNQRFKVGQANEHIAEFNANQALKVNQQKISLQRLANSQFNADRNYAVSLANLGISQKNLQMKITANAFKAAHNGYSKDALRKLTTQANGMAQAYLHGSTTTKTSVVNGVTKTYQAQTAGLPYNAALSQMMKKGIPVQVALDALDRAYPANLRPSPEALNKLLGPLTPANLAAQAQTDAYTPTVAGLSEVSPTSILTQTAPQTRAVKAYAFNNAAAKYGWSDNANLAALDKLWTQESGWNPNAVNPSSGAAGIPQALGHGHVFNLGDYKSQVDWGLNYIRQRYGSPLAAWQHEIANNWY